MQLLREALRILEHEETVKLDATPEGRTVYLKLNFVDEYSLGRMKMKATNRDYKPKTSTVRAIRKDDVSKVVEFDTEIFGADRLPLLEWMLKGAPGLAFLSEHKNEIQGYCLGRPGHDYIHIGPVIAKSIIDAKDLVFAALSKCNGTDVILDIPSTNQPWADWLTSIGFVEQRTFYRMYRGSNSSPGLPQKQFAIMGPEFG
ncbi:MAG: hypothetical protein JJE09_11400 [Bacteroidia bacterium]|nr:hypothetical protein [Bacteroidia bacterium]